jgi:hypothetical protein
VVFLHSLGPTKDACAGSPTSGGSEAQSLERLNGSSEPSELARFKAKIVRTRQDVTYKKLDQAKLEQEFGSPQPGNGTRVQSAARLNATLANRHNGHNAL